MVQKEQSEEKSGRRGLTQKLADYLGEDPAEMENQAAKISIEKPWVADKDK